MTRTLNYPRREASWNDVLRQDVFNNLTSYIMSWQQGLGEYGGLHLHACWSEASVLARRCHGQYIGHYYYLLKGFRELYDRTGNVDWKIRADDLAANLLFLQEPEGGFRHGSGEYEPAFGCLQSTTISQAQAVLALIEYSQWDNAREDIKQRVPEMFERFWNWYYGYWWQRGNGWKRPLDFPGFCGVTNQDLGIVAVLAYAAKYLGKSGPYQKTGRPVLEYYLSEVFYHDAVGLFERGDTENFVERTPYYGVILLFLEMIAKYTETERINCMIENICCHLLDAEFIGNDGLTHLAWGARMDANDKSAVAGWTTHPIVFGAYPELLAHLEKFYLDKADEKQLGVVDGIRRTIAAYIFADGTFPCALGNQENIFAVIAASMFNFWAYMVGFVGEKLQEPEIVRLPCIYRTCGDITLKTDNRVWAIERSGRREFTGVMRHPAGIVQGEGPEFRGLDLSSLDTPEILEHVAYGSD